MAKLASHCSLLMEEQHKRRNQVIREWGIPHPLLLLTRLGKEGRKEKICPVRLSWVSVCHQCLKSWLQKSRKEIMWKWRNFSVIYNMELQRRQSSDSGCQNQNKTNRREVPDLLSWITCFGTYASVVCDKQPQRIRELWAYQTMLVREARRCGGKGWQAYDSMFRQQAAHNSSVDWSVLNNLLYSTSFLTQQNQRGRTCQW